MCANPTGGKWQTSSAPWTRNGLSRMLPCSLCSWYIYLKLFVCIKMVDEHKECVCGGTCVTCIFWMLLAAQPNVPCRQTPAHPLPNLPALPPPFAVAMAACPPRCSELSPTKTFFSHEAVICVILWHQRSPSFLTVVLLQHFFVQQLGHHIKFHIHQEEDVWKIDRAPGLTSKPWPLTLTYYTVDTLWCQPKKSNRGDSFMHFYLEYISQCCGYNM